MEGLGGVRWIVWWVVNWGIGGAQFGVRWAQV